MHISHGTEGLWWDLQRPLQRRAAWYAERGVRSTLARVEWRAWCCRVDACGGVDMSHDVACVMPIQSYSSVARAPPACPVCRAHLLTSRACCATGLGTTRLTGEEYFVYREIVLAALLVCSALPCPPSHVASDARRGGFDAAFVVPQLTSSSSTAWAE